MDESLQSSFSNDHNQLIQDKPKLRLEKPLEKEGERRKGARLGPIGILDSFKRKASDMSMGRSKSNDAKGGEKRSKDGLRLENMPSVIKDKF